MEEHDDQEVEYVELLDVPTYEDDSQIVIQTQEENALHEVITNDAEAFSDVEYIEAEEVAISCDGDVVQMETDDQEHTIIVHDGRQYMIPTEQLNSGGHTIVLEDDEDDDTSEYIVQKQDELIENDDNTVYYTVDGDETTVEAVLQENYESSSSLGRQYAVLQDGKLHIKESQENDSEDATEEVQQKLRDFEHTLNSYEDDDQQQQIHESGTAEDDVEDENSDSLNGITGRNLITGQTISLSGFLEKIRQKNQSSDLQFNSRPHRRRVTEKIDHNFVSIPPVNRRVVVGRTPDGRRLVGRILQIQKKIQPENAAPTPISLHRSVQKRSVIRNGAKPNKRADQPKVNQSLIKLRYMSSLDENVSRTLSGLMDLESVEKSLWGRRLLVRHIQRRSVGGRPLPGTRKVAYYCGKMVRTSAEQWQFVLDIKPEAKSSADGIDLLPDEQGDNQQVAVRLADGGGVVYEDSDDVKRQLSGADDHEEVDDSEPITLNLTVTQDEFGKKRTKVTIPHLLNGGNSSSNRQNSAPGPYDLPSNHCCPVCGKKFQSLGSLRRHTSIHDPSVRPLQCMTCLARFTDESSLRKHMLLHTGARPHKCSQCGKTFAHKGDLNFHSRTHDPVKRYRCEVCGKQFNRHSNMQRHAEIHRPHGEQPPLEELPLAAAPNDTDTDDNIVRRPPYSCDTCGCQYNFVSSLTRHIVNNHMGGDVSAT